MCSSPLSNVVRSIVTARAVARARARCPIYPVLLTFALGQLLAALLMEHAPHAQWRNHLAWCYVAPAAGLVIVLLLPQTLRRMAAARAAAGVFLGAASMLPLLAGYRSVPATGTPIGVTLEVTSSPQSIVPHGIVFRARLLSVHSMESPADPSRGQPNVARPDAARPDAARPISNPDEVFPRAVRCRSPYLPWRTIHGLRSGETRRAVIKIMPLKTPFAPLTFDHTLMRQGVDAYCSVLYMDVAPPGQGSSTLEGLRQHLSSTVSETAAARDPAALFLSMTLGTRHIVSTRVENVFRRTGLSHLLVVSGYQVTVLGGIVLTAIRFTGAHYYYRLTGRLLFGAAPLLSLLTVWFYTILTGSDGSTVRAAVTLTFLAAARRLERGDNFFQSIGVSLLALLIVWPGAFLEPGVQLTFAALFGIGLGLATPTPSKARKFLAVNFYTSLATSIPLLLWFQQISLIGLVLNPLLAPLLSILSCTVGLPALAVAAAVPPSAPWIVGPLVEIIWRAFLVLERLSSYSWAFLTLEPPHQFVATLIPTALIARGAWRRIGVLSSRL